MGMRRGPGALELVAARELSHKGSPACAAEAGIYFPIIQFLEQEWERENPSLPIPTARSKVGSPVPQSLGDGDRGGAAPSWGSPSAPAAVSHPWVAPEPFSSLSICTGFNFLRAALSSKLLPVKLWRMQIPYRPTCFLLLNNWNPVWEEKNWEEF